MWGRGVRRDWRDQQFRNTQCQIACRTVRRISRRVAVRIREIGGGACAAVVDSEVRRALSAELLHELACGLSGSTGRRVVLPRAAWASLPA